MAAIHAGRALALVGTPFRPQGRDPLHGLDCIGLCLAAYGLPSRAARDDYRLRGNHDAEIKSAIQARFRRVTPARAQCGDLLLLQPAIDQLHLGILTMRGFVHADARLRHIVEVPGRPPWPTVGTYRLRARQVR